MRDTTREGERLKGHTKAQRKPKTEEEDQNPNNRVRVLVRVRVRYPKSRLLLLSFFQESFFFLKRFSDVLPLFFPFAPSVPFRSLVYFSRVRLTM